MDLRKLVVDRLGGDPQITAEVGDRIIQRSGMQLEVPEVKPFIVYHFGVGRATGPSALHARMDVAHIWVHDEHGDYYRIDKVLDRVKIVLESTPAQENFFEARWLEKSPDLEDPEMKTITRYCRVMLTTADREEMVWS